jgi:endonuclease III
VTFIRESNNTRLPNKALIRKVNSRLIAAYGRTRLNNKDDPLDELIFIILSGKTQEASYLSTFDSLRRRFPTWTDAARARVRSIESAIKPGGLARKKSRAIKQLLRAIVSSVGQADLAFLRDLDDEAAYSFLRSLPGVGPKTARCVLSYSLGRPAFAVDAHVSRIVRRLGWSSHHRLTDAVHDRLQEMIPPDTRLSLHVGLVLHGRITCTERNPRCSDCVLADLCPSAYKTDDLSA